MNPLQPQPQHHNNPTNEAIIKRIESRPEALDELMDRFFADDWRINQRAAVPLELISRYHPEWLLPYFPRLLAQLKNPKHNAYVRNLLRAWQHQRIPEPFQGEVADYCFEYVANPQAAVAIRVFAMTILKNICQDWPELADELRLVIEEHLPVASPGFKSRGARVLKALRTLPSS